MKEIISKNKSIIVGFTAIVLFSMCIILIDENSKIITTSATALNTKKIEWGIKRNDNHNQPDLGSTNKRIIDELNRNSHGK